jgi:drug/metabolite transporter (DMT)-like permease
MNFPFLHNPTQQRLGMTLAFGALLWSGTYNALAKGLTPFLSPITLLILSELLTAVFIILTFGLVPLCKKLVKLDAKTIRMAIIVGLFNSALAPLLWFTGLAQTSAINASMLSSADILCILLLSSVILKERITRVQAIGATVVMAGVLVLNISSAGEGFNVHMGDLLVFLGALTSGAGSVLFKKYLSHVMPELAILIRNIAGVVAIGIVSIMVEHAFVAEVQAFPVKKVLLLVAFTFFSRYLNLTFYYEALDRLPAMTMSLISIATPLSGLLFAFLILGETIHSYQMLGAIFIVFGLMIEQMSGRSIVNFRSRPFLGHFPHFSFSRQKQAFDVNDLRMLPKA